MVIDLKSNILMWLKKDFSFVIGCGMLTIRVIKRVLNDDNT